MSRLEQAIDAASREGREAWPGVDVDSEWLRAFIAERDTEGEPALETLCLRDLYLACACARGDATALASFERGVMPVAAAAAVRAGAAEVDEVCQVVRDILFVGAAGKSPAIERYSGRGNLKAWVRVIAAREAYRLARRDKNRVSVQDEALFDVLTDGSEDPQLDYLKEHYREKFRAAFRAAVGELGRRERTALRLQVLDGLSIDEIGATYGVHRATAARWLARARDQLLVATRTQMAAQLGIQRAEVDSIIRMISSQLDMSLHSVLTSKK
jgi:RNA polymerase sigma-70 factor (ECF subfamily)